MLAQTKYIDLSGEFNFAGNGTLLLVGEENSAFDQLAHLLEHNLYSQIVLVGNELDNEILELAANSKRVTIHNRHFIPSDLNEAGFVICTSFDAETHQAVTRVAHDRGIMVHVA